MTTTFSLINGVSDRPHFKQYAGFRTDGQTGDDVVLKDSAVLVPKTSESIPIGVWDYYPSAGVFAIGYPQWQYEPNHPMRMRAHKAGDAQQIAVGFWGIQHLTDDSSAYRQLGVLIELVLGGAERKEVELGVDALAAHIFGTAAPGPVTPTVSFVYPPLIHALHEMAMQRNQEATDQAATSSDSPVAEISDALTFQTLMLDFLLTPSSPLYQDFPLNTWNSAVQIENHPGSLNPSVPGPATFQVSNYSMQFDTDSDSVWAKRVDKAGGLQNFNPSQFTALTINNSVANISPQAAARVNLVEVLSRSPNTTFFDPKQEFPFDVTASKTDPIFQAAIKDLLNEKKPDSLAGPIGRALTSKVSKKSIRSDEFSNMMLAATTPDWTPPKVASVVRSMKKLITAIGNLGK